MSDPKTLSQAEMKSLVLLLAQKNEALAGDDFNNVLGLKKLNLEGAIGIIYPCNAYGEKMPRVKIEQMFAFNAHDAPTIEAIETHASMMRDENYEYVAADFVYPDGTFVNPVLSYGISSSGMKDFHASVSGHAARAARTSSPEEFDADWSGKNKKAQTLKS